MSVDVDSVRQELHKRIINFVEENQDRKKILHVGLPPGTGKTYTACKTLFPRSDILTVWLGPTHKQVIESVVEPFNVFHIEGMSRLCEDKERLKKFRNYNVNLPKVLCRQCELFPEQCQYYRRYQELKECPRSFASVHHNLNQNFICEFLEANRSYPLKCLVIDEDPFRNIGSSVEFDWNDLKEMLASVGDICLKMLLRDDRWTNRAGLATYLCFIGLFEVLKKANRRGLSGREFVDIFIESLPLKNAGVPPEDLQIEDLEEFLHCAEMDILIFEYDRLIYENFASFKYVKNILEVVIEIARKCLYYHRKYGETDKEYNLPFYALYQELTGENGKYSRRAITFIKVMERLPDVPVIILDGTGDPALYESVFKREVEVFDVKMDIKRDIIQVTDGLYNNSSLSNPKTRERVFHAVSCLIRKYEHTTSERKPIGIITLKKWKVALSKYLVDKGIDKRCFYLQHYGGIRGLNKIEEFRYLILVGTPEPNIVRFPLEVGAFYEGETPLNTKRIIEEKGSPMYGHNYRCEDPRYFAHIRRVREHEIEQSIERLRFPLYDGKKAFVFSSLPLSFATRRMCIEELLYEFASEGVLKRRLDAMRHNSSYVYLSRLRDGDTKTVMYRRLENVVPFKDNKGLLKDVGRLLLRGGCLECRKGHLYHTEEGNKYIMRVEKMMRELEASI